MEHVDYHVGILRGFVLAHNAHSMVLHALDVVLADHRSKAGPLIGAPATDAEQNDAGKFTPPKPPLPPSNPNFFWTAAEDEKVWEMNRDGKRVEQIMETLPHRTKSSIHQRLCKLKVMNKNDL